MKRDTGINNDISSPDNTGKIKYLWLHLPYLGKEGDELLTKCLRKLKRNFNQPVIIKTLYRTNKLAMFGSNKDKLPMLDKSNLIYCFRCPGCDESYIGKTERNLYTRLDEHCSEPSAICTHLNTCYLFNMLCLPDNLFTEGVNSTGNGRPTSLSECVISNTEILDQNDDWLQLSFLESYHIKCFKPSLNDGVRASKDLCLFS